MGGVGLPAQDIIGLPAAAGVHLALIAPAFRPSEQDEASRHRLRAVLNGVGLAGAIAHFLGWRTDRHAVFPVLVGRAEGLTESWTRWYNPLLYAWALAAALAVVHDTRGSDRRWALAASCAAPLIARAGQRKERWATLQASVNRRWWNRALVPPAPPSHANP